MNVITDAKRSDIHLHLMRQSHQEDPPTRRRMTN
jgi:hypothetical protein